MKKTLLVLLTVLTSTVCIAQTIEEVKREIIRQGLPHHDIVLAQARLETGNFKSERCKKEHNILGIKHKGKYAVYKRWQDCIADYKKCISSQYKGGCYYIFLLKIKYASDKNYIHKLKQF